MAYQCLLYEKKDGVAKLTLNRPDKLNALNKALWNDLDHALTEAEKDDEVRVIVITGAGRAFSAGYDLTEEIPKTPEGIRSIIRNDVVFKVWDSAKPVIAMVNGYCLGGACELAMMCDLTFASENSKFGEPEIKDVDGPPCLIMPWLIGMKKVNELLLTGDLISAAEAERIGMINRVVPAERLEAEVQEFAQKLIKVPAVAIKISKRAIRRTYEILGVRNAIEYGLVSEIMALLSQTKEGKEFEDTVKEKGLKEALKIREAGYKKK